MNHGICQRTIIFSIWVMILGLFMISVVFFVSIIVFYFKAIGFAIGDRRVNQPAHPLLITYSPLPISGPGLVLNLEGKNKA
jgi:hypothetical protein